MEGCSQNFAKEHRYSPKDFKSHMVKHTRSGNVAYFGKSSKQTSLQFVDLTGNQTWLSHGSVRISTGSR